MRQIIMAVCVFMLFVFFGSTAQADLKTLMEVGKSQEAIAKVLTQETKNYNRVKEAINSGSLKEGVSADSIRQKCGEPIIDNIYDKKRKAYRWLYMPATSTHFKGEKLYLFVGDDSKLVGWKEVFDENN